jgi:hypothetical protein
MRVVIKPSSIVADDDGTIYVRLTTWTCVVRILKLVGRGKLPLMLTVSRDRLVIVDGDE